MPELTAESYRKRIYDHYITSAAPGIRPEATEDTSALDALWDEHYLPLLPKDKNARVLDLGCGRGRMLYYLQRRGFVRCVGVDRSPEAVKMAQARGVREAVQGEIRDYLTAHLEAFDCIVTIDVLEHMQKHEILPLLDLIRAALKPGGTLIIETLNADGPTFNRILYADFTHETAFTRYSLHQLLSTAGFQNLEFFSAYSFGTGPLVPLRRLFWRVIRLLIGFYYHMESNSGILHNYHILTLAILAKASKPTLET